MVKAGKAVLRYGGMSVWVPGSCHIQVKQEIGAILDVNCDGDDGVRGPKEISVSG